jgi:hypothetical protein
MQALEAKEMNSSSKIDLKDMLWWISIKDAYKPKAQVTTKLWKKRCISLARWKHIKVEQKWHIVIVQI